MKKNFLVGAGDGSTGPLQPTASHPEPGGMLVAITSKLGVSGVRQ